MATNELLGKIHRDLLLLVVLLFVTAPNYFDTLDQYNKVKQARAVFNSISSYVATVEAAAKELRNKDFRRTLLNLSGDNQLEEASLLINAELESIIESRAASVAFVPNFFSRDHCGVASFSRPQRFPIYTGSNQYLDGADFSITLGEKCATFIPSAIFPTSIVLRPDGSPHLFYFDEHVASLIDPFQFDRCRIDRYCREKFRPFADAPTIRSSTLLELPHQESGMEIAIEAEYIFSLADSYIPSIDAVDVGDLQGSAAISEFAKEAAESLRSQILPERSTFFEMSMARHWIPFASFLIAFYLVGVILAKAIRLPRSTSDDHHDVALYAKPRVWNVSHHLLKFVFVVSPVWVTIALGCIFQDTFRIKLASRVYVNPIRGHFSVGEFVSANIDTVSLVRIGVIQQEIPDFAFEFALIWYVVLVASAIASTFLIGRFVYRSR